MNYLSELLERGHLKFAENWLKMGSDGPNEPLHELAMQENLPAIRLLLKYGANAFYRQYNAETVMLRCLRFGIDFISYCWSSNHRKLRVGFTPFL